MPRKPKTLADYQSAAARRGLLLVSKPAEKVTLKSWWKCRKCSETFEATYSNIAKSSGCPKCAGNMALTKADYKKLARSLGLTFIDPIPANARAKAHWRCKKYGHNWYAPYCNVKRATGCPTCNHLFRRRQKPRRD
jgi:predicted Zn-ribbon and HTH transcriptional regulator